MTTFQKFLITVLFLAVIIVGAFYWQTNRGKETVERNQRKIQKTKELEESKQWYETILKELCSKPLSEATAADLYNCQDLESDGMIVGFGPSPRPATGSANLPAYCDRKITEMKMLELLECLDSRPKF